MVIIIKCLKSPVSEYRWTVNMLTGPKHCSNMHGTTFIIFSHHSHGNRIEKCLRKNIFASLFSVHNKISLSCHEQVCLIRLRFERYFSHHWAFIIFKGNFSDVVGKCGRILGVVIFSLNISFKNVRLLVVNIVHWGATI